MYNQEIKTKYLECGSKTAAALFRILNPFEMEFRRDCAEFTDEQVVTALTGAGIEDIGSVYSYISCGRAYSRWYVEQGFAASVPGGFDSVQASDIDLSISLKRVLFKDEADLLSAITRVCSLDEGLITPPVYVLAWYGVSHDEVTDLRDSQVDLESGIIYDGEGNVIVPRLSEAALDLLRRYVDCRETVRVKGNSPVPVKKDRSIGFFLKRMLPRESKWYGVPYTSAQVDSALGKLNGSYTDLGFPPRLTFTNVQRSGRFYRLWEYEQSGINVLDSKNKEVINEVFRGSKNYYNARTMYEFYRKAFYVSEVSKPVRKRRAFQQTEPQETTVESGVVSAGDLLRKSIEDYNAARLSEIYRDFEKTGDPIREIVRTLVWNRKAVRVFQDGSSEIYEVSTRFSFRDYAKRGGANRFSEADWESYLPDLWAALVFQSYVGNGPASELAARFNADYEVSVEQAFQRFSLTIGDAPISQGVCTRALQKCVDSIHPGLKMVSPHAKYISRFLMAYNPDSPEPYFPPYDAGKMEALVLDCMHAQATGDHSVVE